MHIDKEDGKNGFLTEMTGPQRDVIEMTIKVGSLMIKSFNHDT
jgi:hypothetical protein